MREISRVKSCIYIQTKQNLDLIVFNNLVHSLTITPFLHIRKPQSNLERLLFQKDSTNC